MFLALGIVALLIVLIAVGAAMLVGARHAREEDGPKSSPTDFVKKSDDGEYAWRGTSESTGEFQARVREDDARDPKSARK
jgi:hypothetical protein